MGHPGQVEGNDDLDAVRVALAVEVPIAVVGDDGQDRDLGDRAVGDPGGALPVEVVPQLTEEINTRKG